MRIYDVIIGSYKINNNRNNVFKSVLYLCSNMIQLNLHIILNNTTGKGLFECWIC